MSDRVERWGAVGDPAAVMLATPALAAALAEPERASTAVLDALHRVEHTVPLRDGRGVFVTETFTLRSWLRSPRRASLNLPGFVTLGSAWNIDEPGYDGGARLAPRGFFAFTVDYLGFGRSSCPPDGATLHPLDEVEALRAVLEYIHDRRAVDVGVDLISESVGTGIAATLATDPALVRSLVLTTVMYTGTSETVQRNLLSPEHRAFLESWADGYLMTDGPYYAAVTTASPRPVAEWIAATQPGPYPTGFFLRLFDGLPYFDPGAARAPGLVLVGSEDTVPAPGEAEALARDYGRDGAPLVELRGAGHVPRFESRSTADEYWREVVRFVDS